MMYRSVDARTPRFFVHGNKCFWVRKGLWQIVTQAGSSSPMTWMQRWNILDRGALGSIGKLPLELRLSVMILVKLARDLNMTFLAAQR